MIRLENVSKSYPARGGAVPVLRNINLTVGAGEKIGILGRNGAGKSTLIRLVSGAEAPSAGTIHRDMSVSWPLAFGGAFLGRLTGFDNFKFVCRLYDVDPDSKVDFVEEFCELGRYFREPLRTYSAGMRARLAFAVSMAVEFDCFLIDEIIAVGDSRFQAKCFDELFVKRADRALLVVSHHADFVREVCTSASVLEGGVLRSFASVDEAYELYTAQLAIHAAVAMPQIGHKALDGFATVSAESEAARGEVMEERAHTLARMLVSLDQDANGAALLPAAITAIAGELADFSVALRVIDNVRAMATAEASIRLMHVLELQHGTISLFHVVKGDLLAGTGQDNKAIAAYRKAAEIEPRSLWAQRNLGIALFNIGCYCDAREAFARAIEIPCTDALRLELVRYLIDCATFLDEPVPAALHDVAPFPGDAFEDVTAVYYPALGLLSVRMQGFHSLRPAQSAQLRLVVAAGDETHELPVEAPGSNSHRRYASLMGGGCFGAELVVRCPDKPGEVSVRLLEGSTVLASLPSVGVRDDGHAIPPAAAEADEPVQVAALAYAAHDTLGCILFSRLAAASGATIDHEALAESLIAQGRYHEAEHNLARLFAAGADKGGETMPDGKLFDLLCAEIGRSRLPGWKKRLERLIAERLAANPCDSSASTNLGHLLVADDRIEDAVAAYRKAASLAVGSDVIHFNRGIFSAQFILPEASAPLAVSPDEASAPGLVHLVSCDAAYFKRYGAAVVGSSRTTPGHGETIMHVHVVDPDAESMQLAHTLQQQHEFNLTTEFFPIEGAPRRIKIAYYTSARFIMVPELLEIYRRPVLVTETDCLINWNWGEIIDWCKNADFGSMQSSLNNLVPWTRIPAGIVYFDHRAKGYTLASELRRFLQGLFLAPSTHRYDLWTIDQVALWLTWQRYRQDLDVVHLPMYSILRLATGDKTNIL